MSKGKIIGYSLLGIVLIIGLTFGLGYLDVIHIKTVGKAKQNAKREVLSVFGKSNRQYASDL